LAASADILPAGTKLRLLRDRLLLRPLDWVPSSLIQVVRHGRPLRGVVEAVGPGRLYRRYKPHPNDSRKRTYVETKHFIPTQVMVGDVVELGGLNAYDGAGYNFPQVTIGTETFIIVQEQDVAGIVEQEAA
jgi:co-chaperonin GroES (HSP10)